MVASHDVELPLTDYVKIAARESAQVVIDKHVTTCPIKDLSDRVDRLEGRFWMLIIAIIASGAFGGASGAWLLKIFGGH